MKQDYITLALYSHNVRQLRLTKLATKIIKPYIGMPASLEIIDGHIILITTYKSQKEHTHCFGFSQYFYVSITPTNTNGVNKNILSYGAKKGRYTYEKIETNEFIGYKLMPLV